MRRQHLTILLGALAALYASSAGAQQQNRPPVAEDVEVSSLYRAREEWIIETRVVLRAKDPDSNPDGSSLWRFEILQPQQLVTPAGTLRLRCTAPSPPDAEKAAALSERQKDDSPTKVTTHTTAVACVYQPPVGTTGEETFQYQVVELGGGTSAPATVTVDIKSRGLRWEFVTGAGQSLTSDTFKEDAGTIPDILGKTTQDFMLGLDWVFRNPQRSKDETKIGKTADGHFAFTLGLVNKPEAVTATPVTDAAGAVLASAESEDAVASRRKFTMGGELNYNLVFAASGDGTFVELGGLARGNFDASIEGDDDFEQVGGRLLKIARTGQGVGSFRTELGARFTLKQDHKDMFTTTMQHGPGEPVEFTRNSDDMVAVEFGYQRDSSLSKVESIDVSQHRYFLRIAATLVSIPGAPGSSKPLVTLEVTGAPGQPKQVKVLYGANISAIGAALGLGK